MRTVPRGGGSSEPVHPSGKLAPNRWEAPPPIPEEERRAVKARLQELIRDLGGALGMDRAAEARGRRGLQVKRPCAQCLHWVQGCCGARPMPDVNFTRWPSRHRRLQGRVYERVAGDGCANDFTARGGESNESRPRNAG